jgi:hypothetical protein
MAMEGLSVFVDKDENRLKLVVDTFLKLRPTISYKKRMHELLSEC